MAALMKRIVDNVISRVSSSSSLSSSLGRSQPKRSYEIVVIGLDNAGKSAIVECIIEHDKLATASTNGDGIVRLNYPTAEQQQQQQTNVSTATASKSVVKRILHTTVKKRECHINLYDFAGRRRVRALWEQTYALADAIIFVIDAFDRLRTPIVCFELDMLLNKLQQEGGEAGEQHSQSKNVPILVVLNKRDVTHTMTVTEFELQMRRNLTCKSDTFLVVVEASALYNPLAVWRDFENFLICVDEIQRMQRLALLKQQQQQNETGTSDDGSSSRATPAAIVEPSTKTSAQPPMAIPYDTFNTEEAEGNALVEHLMSRA